VLDEKDMSKKKGIEDQLEKKKEGGLILFLGNQHLMKKKCNSKTRTRKVAAVGTTEKRG